MLRRVLCKTLKGVLDGDFEERVAQLIKYSREEPKWTLDMMRTISKGLRERTKMDRNDPEYLNPDSIDNYFKPLQKLFAMNNVPVHWERVKATYPERDNKPDSRGYTREEIARMLRHSRDTMGRALVLVLASSGVRLGGLDLNWEDLVPAYRVDGRLVLDPGVNNDDIACAMLHVYRGSAESYTSFITPEAFEALSEYGLMWAKAQVRSITCLRAVFSGCCASHLQWPAVLWKLRVVGHATVGSPYIWRRIP